MLREHTGKHERYPTKQRGSARVRGGWVTVRESPCCCKDPVLDEVSTKEKETRQHPVSELG